MEKPLIVVLTGAGISAESGLHTFRDSDGLWEGYNIEDVATPRAWLANQQLVLDFYNQRRRDIANAQPNAAHNFLAQLERDYEVIIVTQNIDDLHERAGSSNVLHLHGEIFKMRSDRQPHQDSLAIEIKTDMSYGLKSPDGGTFRPHIVWFEEAVPSIEKAAAIMARAEQFILVGTSLLVYPAAGLMDCLPVSIPKYIVDKRIPAVSKYDNVIPFEMPATQGLEALCKLLQK